jgi:RNA polymerase sigma-70 factor (ECF subfamily)
MPWLATVARHIVSNDRRGRAARPREVNDACLAIAAAPDDETESVLRRVVLAAALAALTPAHRTVVEELYLRGRSVQEVADIVGVPPGTVKSRAFYAMRIMRAIMKSQGVTP